MNRAICIVLLSVGLLILPPGPHSYAIAAASSSTVNPAIADLADKLAASLKKAGLKRVLVLNFRAPQKESHPVGKWLTDEFSSALHSNTDGLELIDGSKISEQITAEEDSTGADVPWKKQMEIYRSTRADAVVSGSYAKVSQRLGLTLSTTNLKRNGGPIPPISGAVSISDEINGLSTDPIPSFQGDVFRAGIAGITSPICIYCPQPEYTDKARKARYDGTVLLDVIVTTEGNVIEPIVISGSGLGLEERAIKSLEKWRLKPAQDIDNKPVPVKVQIEITFHLYRSPFQ